MPRITVSPTQDDILKALWRFHILLAPQIQRRFFGKGKYAYRLLAPLRAANLVSDDRLHPGKFVGSPKQYQLTVQGMRHLEKNFEYDVARRVRQSEHEIVSASHWPHLKTLNDFLILLELFVEQNPNVVITRITHDLDMYPGMYGVGSGSGKPDAFVELEIDGTPEVWWVEIDRGSLYEDPSRWREKVRFVLSWGETSFTDKFPNTILSVVVIAAPGDRQTNRAEALVHWTELELVKHQEAGWQDAFWVTGCLPEELSPSELFTHAPWYRAEPGRRGTLQENQRIPLGDRTPFSLISPA